MKVDMFVIELYHSCYVLFKSIWFLLNAIFVEKKKKKKKKRYNVFIKKMKFSHKIRLLKQFRVTM
ncbi:hypothetical protein HanRHA438_Chr02g0097261 [Helianthus annuus]|nr:hypothetical protein HanRHA438_Chr02g0097261 [Helianthus annuus]